MSNMQLLVVFANTLYCTQVNLLCVLLAIVVDKTQL